MEQIRASKAEEEARRIIAEVKVKELTKSQTI